MTVREGSRRNKFIVRLAMAATVGIVGIAVLFAAAGIMATITQSEDSLDVFTDAAELPPDLIDAVEWLPDAVDLPREMEPATRTEITASWLRAWEQMRIVAETGDISGVDVYFSNTAREQVLAHAKQWSGRSVHQIGHDLVLTFYSEDGQVAGLTSAKSRLVRTQELDGTTLTRESTESYEAILVLEDGNWRVQHWVRRSVDAGPWQQQVETGNGVAEPQAAE